MNLKLIPQVHEKLELFSDKLEVSFLEHLFLWKFVMNQMSGTIQYELVWDII